MHRAIYKWGKTIGGVWIIDKDEGASVTNDAERVIADIADFGVDFTTCRVVYQDTTGRWDELVVRDGKFAGFAPIGATTRADALAAIGAAPSALDNLPPE